MNEQPQPLTPEQSVEIREDQLALYAESLKWVDPETTAERVFALRDDRDAQAAELTRLREQLAETEQERDAARLREQKAIEREKANWREAVERRLDAVSAEYRDELEKRLKLADFVEQEACWLKAPPPTTLPHHIPLIAEELLQRVERERWGDLAATTPAPAEPKVSDG